MKSKIFFILVSCCIIVQQGNAQVVSVNRLIQIVVDTINSNLSSEDFLSKPTGLNVSFYIEDISTRESIAEHKYGLYEFGQYGDDIPKWIMWYDSTGYKIYDHGVNTKLLGEILEFIKRNNYSDTQAFRYIEGLYKTSYMMENYGEQEISNNP
mgnify:CR=1 FL=1